MQASTSPPFTPLTSLLQTSVKFKSVCQANGDLGPVLSEQMAVAPPMVSQAASTRTKLLSFIICFMLRSSQRHQLSRSHCSFIAKAFIMQRNSKCLGEY